LEIINSKTKDFKIIKYLEDEIDLIELKSLLNLNKLSKEEIIRKNETSCKELKLK
jgi:arsenate reductase-like glutaredoxin family protein